MLLLIFIFQACNFSNLLIRQKPNYLLIFFEPLHGIKKMAVSDSVYAWEAMILGGVFDGFSELSSTLDSILTPSALICGMEPYNYINQVDRKYKLYTVSLTFAEQKSLYNRS